MLAPTNRMRRSSEFTAVVRTGTRARRGAVVVHQLGGQVPPPRIGLIVGRSVGNSVVRHRVNRRLRAQLAARLTTLPADRLTVVRALPAAAQASSAQLGADLDAALTRLAGRS